jgi:hypothetical protein
MLVCKYALLEMYIISCVYVHAVFTYICTALFMRHTASRTSLGMLVCRHAQDLAGWDFARPDGGGGG